MRREQYIFDDRMQRLQQLGYELAAPGRLESAAGASSRLVETAAGLSQKELSRRLRRAINALEGAIKELEGGRPPPTHIENKRGVKAVVGNVKVHGRNLETLLFDALEPEEFTKKLEYNLFGYAADLGYDRATRRQNRAYASHLLNLEGRGKLNQAEKRALGIYRGHGVQDRDGRLVCALSGRGFTEFPRREDGLYGIPLNGVLFVRAPEKQR